MEREFEAPVWKSHNSLAVVIPKKIAELVDLKEGEKAKFALIEKVKKK